MSLDLLHSSSRTTFKCHRVYYYKRNHTTWFCNGRITPSSNSIYWCFLKILNSYKKNQKQCLREIKGTEAKDTVEINKSNEKPSAQLQL